MNATKRKFNALLQGIGARPSSPSSTDAKTRPVASPSPSASRNSTTLNNSASDPDQSMPFPSSNKIDLLKRRRVGAPDSSPTADCTSSLGRAPTITAPGLPTVLLRRTPGNQTNIRNGPIAQDKTPLTTPRYCPGDRDQLIKRLATFQELTDWTPKPDRVNEVEWAKKGWVCMGKERLRCTLCNKEMVVKLNRKEVEGKEVPVLVASEIEDALVEKYAELMVTAHQEDCLWRERGCDDHLIRLPLANPAVALEALRKRYDELCARKDFLPYEFNLRLPEKLDLDSILHNLPPTFFSDPPPPAAQPSTPNRAALALAMIGWQGLENPKIGAVPNSASCHTCLRRLGLWMFKSKEVDQTTGAILVPAMMDHLDPLREHRDFCPWKNGHAQRSTGAGTSSKSKAGQSPSPAGWEVMVQVIKNDSYLRNRSTNRLFGHKGSKSVGGQPASAEKTPAQPTTPVRPTTSGHRVADSTRDNDEEDEDEATRDAKDKERWARLRRVKSLFDPKGKNKLKRSQSRPGTGHGSTPRPDTSNEQAG
ncbi:hypothetical protein PpBr36_04763 [Pyricularia pennisetigena]|uniref:hypothetical protein n=1 Tax=Pyricularia pennisetigena TaxID=1578925 RepID=UPI00114D7ECB|nr:hypothetical protein PpBr36_04763 [Pyricularia pennisetigena]TLS26387.1 hypothetical protein PpBr36_04763 [Pyricularia pennisetigena]